MSVWLEHGGRRLKLGGEPVSLAIPLDFHGPQPSHFGAPAASAQPLSAGDFTGDTRLGGSCNCEQVVLVPHCNGTHTEGPGHVTRERASVHGAALEPLVAAAVVSLEPLPADQSGESADPAPQAGDRLLTARALEAALARLNAGPVRALVVRTLADDAGGRHRNWMAGPLPPYFSLEAMALLVEHGIVHLLTDLPSVDRLQDAGRLAAHRVFWGLPPGSTDPGAAQRPDATITEMIHVPPGTEDGLYALSLQIAAWLSDAAPSRPVLWRLSP